MLLKPSFQHLFYQCAAFFHILLLFLYTYSFALGNILRRAALGVVALGMTSQEVAALETVFRQLDKSNRGTIQVC